ncbi:LysR family transcriptional regulator [Roseovarius sp. 2305UL8-3]|uniref:LysR family transcriptional regulator n=1 Tax=Roseovarius conchicola TaxID=3121636 RepID=UPI0035275DB2
MRINYDFTDIEAFLEVSETGSFQRAAHHLNMSQPTLTRRIRKLEQAIGTELFERTTRSVRITLAGRAFLDRARTILDEARAAQLALQDSSDAGHAQRNAVITLATIPSATHNILPHAIRSYREAGHDTRFRILESLAGETLDLVRDGDVDFGIGFGGLDDPVLQFQSLQSDRFVLALHRDHPLCARDQVDWQDLAGHELIVPWKGTGNRMLIDNALAETGQSLGWYLEIRNSSTSLNMVRFGLGVAVLPQSTLPTEQNAPVDFRELVSPSITRRIGIITRRTSRPGRAVQAFLANLLGEVDPPD